MSYNTRSSRVRMDSINTLTFYNGEMTAARRTHPVPQMECVGKPCSIYQPDVVQCTVVGRNGPDVEWKCEAELPSSIRLGRVEVGCEGYDKADDPFILKGSCGLTYNLVRVSPDLEDGNYKPSRSSGSFTSRFLSNLFNILTIFILFYMAYLLLIRPLLSYFTRNTPLNGGGGVPPPGGGGGGGRPNRPWFGGLGGWGGGGGGGGGAGGGGRPGAPPPPYSEKPNQGTSTSTNTGSSFWSEVATDLRRGATQGAGWTAAEMGVNALFGRNNNNRNSDDYRRRQSPAPAFAPRQPSAYGRDDRGEGLSGTSGLGSMRTSSGFGGTRNR